MVQFFMPQCICKGVSRRATPASPQFSLSQAYLILSCTHSRTLNSNSQHFRAYTM